MTVHQQPDDLLGALRRLSTPLPSTARDARTRARCHDALARPRTRRVRAIDRLLPAAVVAYGVIIVVEGLRIAGLI